MNSNIPAESKVSLVSFAQWHIVVQWTQYFRNWSIIIPVMQLKSDNWQVLPLSIHFATKIRISLSFLNQLAFKFRRVSLVFCFKKSGYQFLIGSSGEEWRGGEEEWWEPTQVQKKRIWSLKEVEPLFCLYCVRWSTVNKP